MCSDFTNGHLFKIGIMGTTIRLPKRLRDNAGRVSGCITSNPEVRIPRPRQKSDLPTTQRLVALLPLSQGLDITSDLIQVRKVMAGYQSQHHIQGLGAALMVLASALQIC